MQFEKKKPSVPDAIPVAFTVPEVEWLSSEAAIGSGATAFDVLARETRMALLRKVMQARRDAVGDKLPASLASLPLIRQDMPKGEGFHGGQMPWNMAMIELSYIDLYPLEPDKPAPHTVAVELTVPELGMVIDMAKFAVRATSEHDPLEETMTEEERQMLDIEPESPESVLRNQVKDHGENVSRNDIARGVLHAFAEYRQSPPEQG